MTIPKGERDELRRVIRQQFKVLAAEVNVRKAEMAAEIEQQIALRFQPNENAIAETEHAIGAIVGEARQKIAVEIEALRAQSSGYDIGVGKFVAPYIEARPTARTEMRRAALADLDARVSGALHRLQRQEADVLRGLAVDAIESDEAKAFLGSIPTVSELVPSTRLAELEASFHDSDDA